MGKILIIKGADFSQCALNNVMYIKLSWDYGEVGGFPRAYTDNHEIPVGSKIGFLDTSLYSKYSYAVSKITVEDALAISGKNSIGNGLWDSSYTGSPYINQTITTTSICYYIFLKKNDNTNFSAQDKVEIENGFKVKINEAN